MKIYKPLAQDIISEEEIEQNNLKNNEDSFCDMCELSSRAEKYFASVPIKSFNVDLDISGVH